MLGAPESAATKVVGPKPVNIVSALQFQIHSDLRTQHPERVEPNGDYSADDFNEAGLAELLESYAQTGSDEAAADVHRALESQLIFNSWPNA